jgi:hypothetical protein
MIDKHAKGGYLCILLIFKKCTKIDFQKKGYFPDFIVVLTGKFKVFIPEMYRDGPAVTGTTLPGRY